MVVSINNPKDIDYAINQLQGWLQSSLFPKWNIDPDDPIASGKYVFYPRVHRNLDQSTANAGYIAELYKGNNEYEEVYWNDQLAGMSWFGQGSIIKHDVQQITDVHLVTFANLETLYPAVAHRPDNEIRVDFQRVFEAPIFGFTLMSTEIWIPNVLREYPGSRRDNRLQAADMAPVHAFRLNLRLVIDGGQLCPEPFLSNS